MTYNSELKKRGLEAEAPKPFWFDLSSIEPNSVLNSLCFAVKNHKGTKQQVE